MCVLWFSFILKQFLKKKNLSNLGFAVLFHAEKLYMYNFFTANLLKKGTFEFCLVPFTTYNNTSNLRISQSAVFCSVQNLADWGFYSTYFVKPNFTRVK